MAPYNWLILFIMFNLIYLMFLSHIQFTHYLKFKNNLNSKKKNFQMSW